MFSARNLDEVCSKPTREGLSVPRLCLGTLGSSDEKDNWTIRQCDLGRI